MFVHRERLYIPGMALSCGRRSVTDQGHRSRCLSTRFGRPFPPCWPTPARCCSRATQQGPGETMGCNELDSRHNLRMMVPSKLFAVGAGNVSDYARWRSFCEGLLSVRDRGGTRFGTRNERNRHKRCGLASRLCGCVANLDALFSDKRIGFVNRRPGSGRQYRGHGT
jgi:hypothetical protein